MKKGRLLFVFLLVLSLIAAGGLAEDLFLLWDIPFGISMEEATSLIAQNTGIVMELRENEQGYSWDYLISSKGQDLLVAEKPAEIWCAFFEDTLTDIYVRYYPGLMGPQIHLFDQKDTREKRTAMMEMFRDYDLFFRSFNEKYGAAKAGLFMVSGDEGLVDYRYPLENGGINPEFLTEIAEEEGHWILRLYSCNFSRTMSIISSQENTGSTRIAISLEVSFHTQNKEIELSDDTLPEYPRVPREIHLDL